MQPTIEQTPALPNALPRVSWSTFATLEDDDRRELVQGSLVEAEMPTPLHAWIVGVLLVHLHNWAVSRGVGYALNDGVKLRIDEQHARIPDLMFVKKGNPLRMTKEGIVQGTPDVIVEVVSAAASDQRRDRVHKLREYERIGVPEYWIVDADAHSFERLVLKDGEYAIRNALVNDEIFTSPDYEGLEIPLARLWDFPGTLEPAPEG